LFDDLGEGGRVDDAFEASDFFPSDAYKVPPGFDDAASEKTVALWPAHVPDDFAGPKIEKGRAREFHHGAIQTK
jgi:hypothetical protein